MTRSSAGSPWAWGKKQPETEFQVGLRKFSMLLVQVAGVLTGAIFIINVALHKPVIDALLFSLSIAVGHLAAAAPGGRLD